VSILMASTDQTFARFDHLDLHGLSFVEITELLRHYAAYISPIERLELAARLPTRRRFLITAGGALLLTAAGCAGGDGAATDAATAVTAEPATRRFEDDTGATVNIPRDPQRIVTLDDRTLEAALGVGAAVVGAVGRYPTQMVPAAYDDLAQSVTFIGVEPNLETITRLQPDLIIAQGYAVEEIADQLRAIAPLVVLEHWTDDSYTTTQWETHFRRVADAANRSDRAQQELDRLAEEITAFQADFPGDIGATELSLVQIQPEQWLFFTEVSFAGELVKRLGFARPAAQRQTDTDRVYLSYEELPLADADVVVLTRDTLEEGVAQQVEAVTTGPLWQQLQAVQAGQVHTVDGFLWLTAGSVPSALGIIADLRNIFMAAAYRREGGEA
jgi:iron complex transport system substrate-binding protein